MGDGVAFLHADHFITLSFKSNSAPLSLAVVMVRGDLSRVIFKGKALLK